MFKKICFFILLATGMVACVDDDVMDEETIMSNEIISGTVFIDDILFVDSVLLLQVPAPPEDTTQVNFIDAVIPDADGRYFFDNVTVGMEGLFLSVKLRSSLVIRVDSAVDESPDGDEASSFDNTIGVLVNAGQTDADNNFYVGRIPPPPCLSSLTGSVYRENICDELMGPMINFRVRVFTRDANGDPEAFLGETTTNVNGYYEIDDISIDYEEVVTIVDTDFEGIGTIRSVRAIDETPGSDPTVANQENYLYSNLLPCLIDGRNDFYIVTESSVEYPITGAVWLDDDRDGVPEEGLANLRIELYRRSPDGVPMTPLLDAANTAADGTFRLDHTIRGPEFGEFVLYFIGNGTPGYRIYAATDLDRETGEPLGDGPPFLPVNITPTVLKDSLNVFFAELN